MIELQRVGFCREMSLGRDTDPSLDTVRADAAAPDAERVEAYLRAGHVYRDDESDTAASVAGAAEPRLLTDGRFVWSSELVEYLRAEHVRLPDEFLAHMAAFSWRVPEYIDPTRLRVPGAVPSLAGLLNEVRAVWPEFVSTLDMDSIRAHLVEAKRSLGELFDTLGSLAAEAVLVVDMMDGDDGDDAEPQAG